MHLIRFYMDYNFTFVLRVNDTIFASENRIDFMIILPGLEIIIGNDDDIWYSGMK